jgi:ketosteroid isomerase-like protein
MTAQTLKTTAEKLVAHCRANTTEEGLDELYDPGAVSVEAAPGPGQDSRETVGVEGIRGKHQWWDKAMEVHSASAEGPFLHGDDRFAVIFEFDASERESGKRVQMREVAIYTVNAAGKITREEFYYNM